ncbi:hypothetical protein EYV94_15275 [Puteibacter caeruleilacunae]|nr:hypothetical protein EYV94_15275 [Puteibacter caeruleilacunae]
MNTTNHEKTVRSFKTAWESLTGELKRAVRRKIESRCGWGSRMTFYNKLNERTELKASEAEIVEQAFAEHDVDPWTGSALSKIA